MKNKDQIIETMIQVADSHFTQFSANEQDKAYFTSLYDDFAHDIDVLSQLKLFHAWCLDQHPQKIQNTRLRIRSWMQNAVNNKNTRTPQGHAYKPV